MLTVSNTANSLLGSRGRVWTRVPLQIPEMLPEVVDREIVLPRPRDRRASRRVVRPHDASAAVPNFRRGPRTSLESVSARQLLQVSLEVRAESVTPADELDSDASARCHVYDVSMNGVVAGKFG